MLVKRLSLFWALALCFPFLFCSYLQRNRWNVEPVFFSGFESRQSRTSGTTWRRHQLVSSGDAAAAETGGGGTRTRVAAPRRQSWGPEGVRRWGYQGSVVPSCSSSSFPSSIFFSSSCPMMLQVLLFRSWRRLKTRLVELWNDLLMVRMEVLVVGVECVLVGMEGVLVGRGAGGLAVCWTV